MEQENISGMIEERFEALSPRLREAARFVIDNPEMVALNSMRTVAARARVHPTTMLRLARELGFSSYDPFRNRFRDWLAQRGGASWSGRAQTLRAQSRGSESAALVHDVVAHEHSNLQKTFATDLARHLEEATVLIERSRTVYILGLRSLFPVAFYLNYVCRMVTDKTVLMTALAGTFADELRYVGEDDTLIVFSYRPYAADAIKAVDLAKERGARLVSITDSRVSPVVAPADVSVIVSNDTPSLFPTILPAFAVAEALAALVVSRSDEETIARIASSEELLDRFNVYSK